MIDAGGKSKRKLHPAVYLWDSVSAAATGARWTGPANCTVAFVLHSDRPALQTAGARPRVRITACVWFADIVSNTVVRFLRSPTPAGHTHTHTHTHTHKDQRIQLSGLQVDYALIVCGCKRADAMVRACLRWRDHQVNSSVRHICPTTCEQPRAASRHSEHEIPCMVSTQQSVSGDWPSRDVGQRAGSKASKNR